MKISSSNKLNAAMIFMLHFAFVYSGRVFEKGLCVSVGTPQYCEIPPDPPGTETEVFLEGTDPALCPTTPTLYQIGSVRFLMVENGCQIYYETREKDSEKSGEDTSRPTNILTCGRRGSSDGGYRIIAGEEARECEFPWFVFLSVEVSPGYVGECGGSILDRSHILTAAHCVAYDNGTAMPADLFTIYSGIANNRDALYSGRSTKSYAAEIHSHPYWKKSRIVREDDIAIIKLKQPLDWDECHSPVCLPDGKTDPRNGGDCIVAGWGRTTPGPVLAPGPKTNSLMWTDIDIVSCNISRLSKSFCSYGSSRGVCEGDSGGPLACRRSDTEGYTQYGVVSAVAGKAPLQCGFSPNLYMDVTKYLPWINVVLGK